MENGGFEIWYKCTQEVQTHKLTYVELVGEARRTRFASKIPLPSFAEKWS
jgi:hypothetical protein